MNKIIEFWRVDSLPTGWAAINFPEYQREPTVWRLSSKQRLIDSILRGFDIGVLYFYRQDPELLDCIDGRQRLSAIASFLGINESEEDETHNGFVLKLTNEVYPETSRFSDLAGRTWADIEAAAAVDPTSLAAEAATAVRRFLLTAVILSDAEDVDEFNLQFTRLNVGVPLNAGEKLHAMVGDMRDLIFDPTGISEHRFFREVGIPTRRYAKQQVAAQVVAQVFSLRKAALADPMVVQGELAPTVFAATRHLDQQKFFKDYVVLGETERAWVSDLRALLDALDNEIGDAEPKLLRNRAIAVSTVVLAWHLRLHESPARMTRYVAFLRNFLCRLRWQVKKGRMMDESYAYLIDKFQRHVTQASVEKRAVVERHRVLSEGFQVWLQDNEILGDSAYRSDNPGRDPSVDCQEEA